MLTVRECLTWFNMQQLLTWLAKGLAQVRQPHGHVNLMQGLRYQKDERQQKGRCILNRSQHFTKSEQQHSWAYHLC